MNELKVIMQDIENVYHQLGAVLRELDTILEDMNDKIHDPSNVDTAPPDEYDDGMDGDHASALASAGWGTDEDYGG